MSYTLTMDASHKVKKSGSHQKAFLRHICREADDAKGHSYTHRNHNIVPARTPHNRTWVNDGAGSFERGGSEEMEAYLAQRLLSVKKPMRSDAVVMRPLILQMDPQWFEDNCPDWKQTGSMGADGQKLTNAMIRWASEQFGQENLAGLSLHLDEYSPQLHVAFTPVTSDGRLSQKDFFPNPTSLKKMHQGFRKHMEAAGFDVEHSVTERSQDHLSSSEFQKKADKTRKDAKAAEALRTEAQRERDAAAGDRLAAAQERAEARSMKSTAKDEGYAQGHAEGRSEALTEVAAELLEAQRARRAHEALQADWEASLEQLTSFPPVLEALKQKNPQAGKNIEAFAAHYAETLRSTKPKKTAAQARAELASKTAGFRPTETQREL